MHVFVVVVVRLLPEHFPLKFPLLGLTITNHSIITPLLHIQSYTANGIMHIVREIMLFVVESKAEY